MCLLCMQPAVHHKQEMCVICDGTVAQPDRTPWRANSNHCLVPTAHTHTHSCMFWIHGARSLRSWQSLSCSQIHLHFKESKFPSRCSKEPNRKSLSWSAVIPFTYWQTISYYIYYHPITLRALGDTRRGRFLELGPLSLDTAWTAG